MSLMTIPRHVYNSIYIGSLAAHILNGMSLDIARRLAREEMSACFLPDDLPDEAKRDAADDKEGLCQ